MRSCLNIYLVALSALLLMGCEKEPASTTDNNHYPIFNGYMQFSTDVSTRAQLATNMRGKDFGVFGYQYNTTTTWSAAKATATPKVFYNQQVSCDANGNCTYDVDNNNDNGNQYKQWETQHYSFFAYHPYGGSGITFSGQNDVNTPMLMYTYGWYGNDPKDRIDATSNTNIFDLMTAEHVDADGSTNVGLNFKHRMFAIEVLANNYNENVYQYEESPVYVKDANGNYVLDANGNKIQSTDTDGIPIFEQVISKDENGEDIILESARETLGIVTIKLENLRYNTMTIPISMASGEIKPVYGGPAEPFSQEFIVSMRDVEIPAYNETIEDEYGKRGGGIPTSISKIGSNNGGYLMLIPQDAIQGKEYNIKFSLNWLNKPTESDDIKTTFESTINFEAGRLYQVIINFVGSGITIALIEAGSWDPWTVEHTFE